MSKIADVLLLEIPQSPGKPLTTRLCMACGIARTGKVITIDIDQTDAVQFCVACWEDLRTAARYAQVVPWSGALRMRRP